MEAMFKGRSWTLNGGNVESQKLDTIRRQLRKAEVGHYTETMQEGRSWTLYGGNVRRQTKTGGQKKGTLGRTHRTVS